MKCEACGHVNETRKKVAKSLPNEDFEAFWKSYPRKVGKHLASKVWKGIKGDEFLFQKIMQAVSSQRRSTDWQRDNGVYIPHASTWLNQRRWDDEVSPTGETMRQIESQDPLNLEKQQAAKERLAEIAQKEWDKREKVRLAQGRDDKRSQKMMQAAGEKEDDQIAIGVKEISNMIFRDKIIITKDDWIKEFERRGSDED